MIPSPPHPDVTEGEIEHQRGRSGTRTSGPGSNQMSQRVTWLPGHPGIGYSACLLVPSSCCPPVGWLIDSTSLGEESRMGRKDEHVALV